VSPRPVVYDTPRRLVAEALGTAFLLATVIGSGIMAERLADGNLALALLCNTIPTGAILAVLILILGPVSGAHFNPAVTLSFLLQREFSAGDAIAYVAAQAVGGVAGTWCAHAMFDEPVLMLSLTPRTGAGQWLGETIATFGLVATIIACVRLRPAVTAPAVGLYITAAYWFTSSTSFANPAVTVARSLSDTFAGIRPADAPAFIAAQCIGAILATWLLGWLIRPAPQPRQPARAAVSSEAAE
jgi:glycerol uptake facilitator-like aquaporin